MTSNKRPVRYEDISTTPAQVLLDLSHDQLDALIHEAERAACHADTVMHWLKGIKIEKTFREEAECRIGGEA